MINDKIIIRNITEEDYPAIKRIFEEGIKSGNAAFEKTAPEWSKWNEAKLPYCRLAAEIANEVVGWAALSPTSKREVYKGINEESIYIASAHLGKGIGKMLLNALIEERKNAGCGHLLHLSSPKIQQA